jgi:PAS domain S-box-containing protein
MNADPATYQEPAGATGRPAPAWQRRRALDPALPWRTVLVIVFAIFVGETAAMIVLTRLALPSPFLEVVDGLWMAALCFGLLYRFVLQPLQEEVCQRRAVEAELRIQTTALHATVHGVLITDRTGRICWANPAFFAMSGYTLDEILGQTPRLFKSGSQGEADYRRLWQTILAGEVWQGEMINRRKDGTLYVEEQTITPVRDESDQVAYFIALKTDCTQRKEAEAQLAQRNRELHALSQAEHHQRQFAEALVQATHALNTSLELEEVLDCILEQTQAIVACRAATVMLLRGNWVDVPRHRDTTGAAQIFTQGFPLDFFPELHTIAALRTPLLVMDTAVERPRTAISGLEWVRSEAVAPLIEGNRVTGFLVVLSEQPAFFSHETLACLMAFAAHAAAALHNARLYRAELYARRMAETLSAASLDLTRTLHLHAVLDSLLRHLGLLVAYDGAHIALLDDTGTLTVAAAAGADPYAAAGQTSPVVEVVEVVEVDDSAVLQSLLYEQESLIVNGAPLTNGSSYFARLAPVRSWLGVPIAVGDRVVGMCALVKQETGFFTTEHVRLTEVMVAQAAVAIQNALLFQQVQTGHERLQSLSRRLVQVQENERRHVARELHDEAGQALASLKYGLRQLKQQAADPAAVLEAVGNLSSVTDVVLENLHRLAVDLRPAALDHLGLVVALRDHLTKLSQQVGLEGRLEAIGFDQKRLPAEVETTLYRVAQEALTNIVRHAQATQVDLLLHACAASVRLTIEDNGVGFDPAAVASSNYMGPSHMGPNHMGPDRLGLVGMRERCDMLGGRLTVESTPGSGTTLVVELPCHDSYSDSR